MDERLVSGSKVIVASGKRAPDINGGISVASTARVVAPLALPEARPAREDPGRQRAESKSECGACDHRAGAGRDSPGTHPRASTPVRHERGVAGDARGSQRPLIHQFLCYWAVQCVERPSGETNYSPAIDRS